MERGYEQRDPEPLALARQYKRIGECVHVRDDSIRRPEPELVKEVDPLDLLGERAELGEVASVGRVVRSGWAGHDERRGVTSSPERGRRRDGGLDALSSSEPGGQHE